MSSPRLAWLGAVVLAACSSPDDTVDAAPIARAGLDLRVIRGDEAAYVELDGSASYDPDGDEGASGLTFTWSVIRSPNTLFLAPDVRGAPRPVIELPTPGLYIFQLVVDDGHDTSAPDYVNVWVIDAADLPPAPDVGHADAGPPDTGPGTDGGALDLGAAIDGTPPPGDAASPAPADAAPPPGNRAPVAVADVAPERVRVGEPVQLSAARSRDDGQPGPLGYAWSVVQAPFGARSSFTARAVAARFVPDAPGRYTIGLRVSDGELAGDAEVVVHVAGDRGYVLDSPRGRIVPVDLVRGVQVGVPIPYADTRPATGFAVRAGVAYVTVRSEDGRASAVMIVAPGTPPVRRLLPDASPPAAPVPGRGGVWVPMQSAQAVYFTDPLGEAPLASLALPEGLDHGWSLAWRGADGYLSATRGAAAVSHLDLRARRWLGTMLSASGRCLPRDVLLHGDFLYVGCRNQNAVVRVSLGYTGPIEGGRIIVMAGGSAPHNFKMIRSGDRLVVMHQLTEHISVIPLARFDLPADHPDRAPERQTVIPIDDAVVDIAAHEGRVYALVNSPSGGSALWAVDPVAGRTLWGRPLSIGGATRIAVDVADELQVDLGRL